MDHKQTKTGCDQLVAAAAGVQFPAERSQFFYESFFDEMVHVLGGCTKRFEPRAIRPSPLGNLFERPGRLLHFRSGENTEGVQSFSPRAIYGNFSMQETAI